MWIKIFVFESVKALCCSYQLPFWEPHCLWYFWYFLFNQDPTFCSQNVMTKRRTTLKMCLALFFFTVWDFYYIEVIGKIAVRKYKYLQKGNKFIQGILRKQAKITLSSGGTQNIWVFRWHFYHLIVYTLVLIIHWWERTTCSPASQSYQYVGTKFLTNEENECGNSLYCFFRKLLVAVLMC